MTGHTKTAKKVRDWDEGGKAHDQAKAQPRKRASFKKNEKSENGSRHKKQRMGGRMCRQASRPRLTHK